MNKKVVSSLAMLLVGFATTAYAGGYYHGDHYYSGNINTAPVTAITYTRASGSIFSNRGLETVAKGAELFVDNEGRHNGFGLWNKNKGPVLAKTVTVAERGNVSNNDLSATAVGAVTGVKSDGSHNYFFIKNGNWGPVTARTETYTPYGGRVQFNNIVTTAVGAQTILESSGHGNHGLIFNINDGRVRATTYTSASSDVVDNAIETTAVGAAVSIDDTKVSGRHFGRYYRSGLNGFGSFNLNLGNVAAQTNTIGKHVHGNTISTTAVGASTSITVRTGGLN
jgi:hypothetical protein